MERIINIDINDKHDLYEPYNDNYLNHHLIDYLVKQANNFKKGDQIIIKIDNNATKTKNFETIMKQTLKHELNTYRDRYKKMNIRQGFYTLLGFFILCLAYLIPDSGVWNEVLIIAGTVPIWESLYVEFFKDSELRKKIHVLKLLLNSKIKTI